MSRPLKLGEAEQSNVCALLTAGFTRKMAAEYVGCSLPTLIAAAKRDPDFNSRMRRAELDLQLRHMRNLVRCSKRSWRASAWAVNRNDAVVARRQCLTISDLHDFAALYTQLICRHLPPEKQYEVQETLWNDVQRPMYNFIRRRTGRRSKCLRKPPFAASKNAAATTAQSQPHSPA